MQKGGKETMLNFLETAIIYVKMFLLGARCISERKRSSPNYQKLNRMGIKVWFTHKGTFITKGKDILISSLYSEEFYYCKETDKMYIKGYTDDKFIFCEISHEIEYDEYPRIKSESTEILKLVEFECKNTGVYFEISLFHGYILISSADKYIIYNFIRKKKIKEGYGECTYYQKLRLFLVENNFKYFILWPVFDEKAILVECNTDDVVLQNKIELEEGYFIDGNRVIFLYNDYVAIKRSFDEINEINLPNIGYEYLARKGKKNYLISTGESYKELDIPGNKIDQLYPELEELQKYVVISNADEVIIAEINPNDGSLHILKRGAGIKFKKAKLDFDKGGILIPIKVKK